jgi:hypothetical protein
MLRDGGSRMDIAKLVKHDDELIAAQATNKIFLSHVLQEPFGHFLQ